MLKPPSSPTPPKKMHMPTVAADQAVGLRRLFALRDHPASPETRPRSTPTQPNSSSGAIRQIGLVICPERPFLASALVQHWLRERPLPPTLWLDAIDFRDREGQGLPVPLRHDLEQVRMRHVGWEKACGPLAPRHWYASARRLQALDPRLMQSGLAHMARPNAAIGCVLVSAHLQHLFTVHYPAQLLWVGSTPPEPAHSALQACSRMLPQGLQLHTLQAHTLRPVLDAHLLAQQLGQEAVIQHWLDAIEGPL